MILSGIVFGTAYREQLAVMSQDYSKFTECFGDACGEVNSCYRKCSDC